MVDGKRPNGVPVAPQMPYGFYKILTPGDLDALVAYVQTVEPVRREVSPPVYKAEAHAVAILGGETSIGSDVPADPVKRGFYLERIRPWRIAWNAIRASPTARRILSIPGARAATR